jgi:uncharacterized protein (TIGR03083 family)
VTIDRDQLLGIARAERDRLGRMIQFADPETWGMPSAVAGWWNRDVMAHLAASDTAAAQLLAGEAASELDGYRDSLEGKEFTVDGWNSLTVSRRAEIPDREILETWGRAAEAVVAYAARLDDDAWRDNRYDWLAGEIAARYLIQSRIVEWFIHGEDMRATNGVRDGWQLRWQHWPAHLTIDLGVRMLPWALAREGYDLSGASVRFDVGGAGEGVWHWGLGAGESPAPDKKPDAEITGRAPQLALVAGRRLAAEDALDSGNLVLGGDAALGEIVLRVIRAYP